MNCFLLAAVVTGATGVVLVRTSVGSVDEARTGAPTGVTAAKVVVAARPAGCEAARRAGVETVFVDRAGVETLVVEREGCWAPVFSGSETVVTHGAVSTIGACFGVDVLAAKSWTSVADAEAAKPQQQRSVAKVNRVTGPVYAADWQARQGKISMVYLLARWSWRLARRLTGCGDANLCERLKAHWRPAAIKRGTARRELSRRVTPSRRRRSACGAKASAS